MFQVRVFILVALGTSVYAAQHAQHTPPRILLPDHLTTTRIPDEDGKYIQPRLPEHAVPHRAQSHPPTHTKPAHARLPAPDHARPIVANRYENVTTPDCGTARRRQPQKIVGGQRVDISQVPWQVSLRTTKWGGNVPGHYCGGSILNKLYVLTAAHCVDNMRAGDIEVVMGTSHIRKTGDRIKVAKILAHQGYDADKLVHDIALLKLAHPIPVLNKKGAKGSAAIRGVCLPRDDAEYSDTSMVTGWGKLSEKGKASDDLMAVDVGMMSDQQCRRWYGKSRITDGMLCAGYEHGGKDACQGDSGGPLVTMVNGRYVLTGIVSWGYGCAQPGNPGVYTQTSKYIGWIHDTINRSRN